MAASPNPGLVPPYPGLATPRPRSGEGWEARGWSFGPEEDREYGGVPGYRPPPGSGPPPPWADSPYGPPGWR
jgi:hypothetical protein